MWRLGAIGSLSREERMVDSQKRGRTSIRPGLSLSWQRSGDPAAPALTLITGLGGLKEGWFRQVPYFEDRFQVLIFDNRGMGGSDVLDVPVSMRDLAEDTKLLLDQLGITSTHIWGVSMGAKIAQELALSWPERVSNLVLGCTHSGDRVEGAASSPLREMHALDEDAFLTRVVPMLFGREYREANARSMRAFARSRSRRAPDPVAIRRQWEAYDSFNTTGRLPEILHRTLVITGDEDALCSPENSQRLAARLPNAELAIVPGAGHSFHIEKPALVNSRVGAFLS